MQRSLPAEASGDAQQAQGPPSGVAGDMAYLMVDRTKGQRPAWVEDMQLDPEDSCLAQRYNRTVRQCGTSNDGERPDCGQDIRFLRRRMRKITPQFHKRHLDKA